MAIKIANKNWEIERGRDWARTVVVYQDVARTTRFDLTGLTLKAQIRSRRDQQGDPLASFTIVVTDAANGEFTMSLDAADTITDAIYDTNKAWWDMIDTTNNQTYIRGKVQFSGSVTTVA
jgi:hypothetical protein